MDLGYHFDLCDIVLREHDYSESAITLVKIGNAVTDLVGNVMSLEFVSDAIDEVDLPTPNQLAASKKLHADNLFEAADLQRYWRTLFRNVRDALDGLEQQFDVDGDESDKRALAEKHLLIVGMALHAVQDFCSHSTWVYRLPAAARGAQDLVTKYRRETPFNEGGNPILDRTVSTGWYEYFKPWEGWKTVEQSLAAAPLFFHDGLHKEELQDKLDEEDDAAARALLNKIIAYLENNPDAAHGIHLDAQDRAPTPAGIGRKTSWDEAYLVAYVACWELMAHIKSKFDPAGSESKLGAFARRLEDSGIRLAARQHIVHQLTFIFMWINWPPHHNGHWKGSGSGDLLSLASNGLASVAFTLLAFRGFFKGLGKILKKGKGAGWFAILLALYSVINNLRKLIRAAWTGLLNQLILPRFFEALPALTKDLYTNQMLASTSFPMAFGDTRRTVLLRVHQVEFDASIHEFPQYLPGPGTTISTEPQVVMLPGDAPDVFATALVQDYQEGSQVPTQHEYRERTMQNRVGKRDGQRINFTLKEPWSILHVVSDPQAAFTWVNFRLFDEDTLIRFGDDEYKVSDKPTDDYDDYGVWFKLALADGTIVESRGAASLLNKKIADEQGAPVSLELDGKTTAWFFRPRTAKVKFSLALGELEPDA